MENYALVTAGFRKLHPCLLDKIGHVMRLNYGDGWWDEVLSALRYPAELPACGKYGELLDSLDVAYCLKLMLNRWNGLFSEALPYDARNWVGELRTVRNETAHIGQQDYPQEKAERALHTMLLLCRELDEEGAEAIEEIYRQVRARASDVAPVVEYVGLAQPAPASGRSALGEGSLLLLNDPDLVQKTMRTRSVYYGGRKVDYPVYKVRLDLLYYNDQNDRIATWISKYENEQGGEALRNMDRESYNAVIEEFIADSNPAELRKTQNNIALIGQNVAGVTLTDGRIVDGNRRFTCLRRLQRTSSTPMYFETVIMDVDIQQDRKQIKLLELAVQHGEEKKVDYDRIDHAIGTYRDIVQTGLLTVQEYAESAGESQADVKKRIQIAEIICEFLDYIGLPGQYHVARELEVFSVFKEMLPSLKKLRDEQDKLLLKTIAFNNALLKAMPDQRKFIRDIKSLVDNQGYRAYFDDHVAINVEIIEKLQARNVQSVEDIATFAADNGALARKMQNTMEGALRGAAFAAERNVPAVTVNKCVEMLYDIDSRSFARLEEDNKAILRAGLEELNVMVERLLGFLS